MAAGQLFEHLEIGVGPDFSAAIRGLQHFLEVERHGDQLGAFGV